MEALGRICEKKFPGQFVGDCYVLHPRRSLEEPYSGKNPEALNDGWSLRVKLESESCPEGVWVHFPDYPFAEEEMTGEIGIALRRLGVEDGGFCGILEARCDVPGVGDIPAQYDNVEDLFMTRIIWASFWRSAVRERRTFGRNSRRLWSMKTARRWRTRSALGTT